MWPASRIGNRPQARIPAPCVMRFARDRTEGLLLAALIAVTLALAVATGLSVETVLAQLR